MVHTGQACWMVLILQWKMMKFTERSALVIVHQDPTLQILFKNVAPTSSTNFTIHLFVSYATVVQTECEANLCCAVRGLIMINRSVGTYV